MAANSRERRWLTGAGTPHGRPPHHTGPTCRTHHVGVVEHLKQLDLVAQVVDELDIDAAHLHALERVLLARAAVRHLQNTTGLVGEWGGEPRARVEPRGAATASQAAPARTWYTRPVMPWPISLAIS